MQKTARPRTIASNAIFLLGEIWQKDRMLLFLLLANAITGVLAPYLSILLPKFTLDRLALPVPTLLRDLSLYTLLLMAVYALRDGSISARYGHYNGLRVDYIIHLYLHTYECDYSKIESAEGQAMYQRAMQATTWGDGSGVSRMVPAIPALIVGALGFLLYGGLIGRLNPLIALLLTCTAALNHVALTALRKWEHAHKANWSPIEQRLSYIQDQTENAEAGKDIRLYRMKSWFESLFHHYLEKRVFWERALENRRALTVLLDAFLILLRDGFAYAYLITRVLNGSLPVPDFVLYFGAVTGFSGWVTQIIRQADTLASASLQVSDMRAFLDVDKTLDPNPAAAPPSHTTAPEIRFENVTFRYDPSTPPFMQNLSFTLKAGERVALVGANGAGKTTLVKLLTGLYPLESGHILIGGVDINEMKREDRFALFAAVFQDLAVFPFTIAENVALRKLDEIDFTRVRECLQISGLIEAVDALPLALDTPLLRVLASGTNLSGGQTQKLLLARALYKNAPILVLDEPTAALDPIAESELYVQYAAFAQNKTSLYISHRLASTRFCDRILFLEEGAIVEEGTHEHLMQQGGQYAHMFDVQSHYYKKSAEPTEDLLAQQA